MRTRHVARVRYKRLIDCPEGMRKLLEAQLGPEPLKPAGKPTKYGNVRTQINGVWFDSKAEAEEDQKLRLQEAAGEIAGYARQVSIPLRTRKGKTSIPKGPRRRDTRIRLDFLVNARKAYTCEHCSHMNHIFTLVLRDKKGFVTREWETKRRILEGQLGVEIEVI